jgi:ArsR family transcriptional regulator
MSAFEAVSTGELVATSAELARLFKALSHPRRLEILQLLRGGELCVCEIEAALDLRQAYVSQQLTVLREAGLVCYRKEGWNVRYRLARPEVYTLMEMAITIHDGLGLCAIVAPDETPEDSCGRCPATTGD